MSDDRERTALYRIRGEEDALLYIGITNSVSFRWNGHQAVQPWWDELRSLTVEWYSTRPQAEEAEKTAILAEQPKYNVTYLKPGRWRSGRERPQLEVKPVGWENFMLDPRSDDEDLVSISDVLAMTRQHSTDTSALRRALKLTAGPEGFKIGSTHLFRKGEIRRWIAAVEASQKPQAAPVPPVAVEKPRDKRPARVRALPGLEPLFDMEAS